MNQEATDDGDSAKRRTSPEGYLLRHFANEKISWEELWLTQCVLLSLRSSCTRDRVGATIVTRDNRVVAMGYNGPPAGMPSTGGPCSGWCERAKAGENGCDLDKEYYDCPSIHAEMNAILRASSREDINGATLYVNSAVCQRCAVTIANSGIARVIMRVRSSDRHRDPNSVAKFLADCGIEVIAANQPGSRYRQMFILEHGLGPHDCYFCGGSMPWLEVVHHIDGDHSNHVIKNLAPAHHGCHSRHHVSLARSEGNARTKSTRVQGTWKRKAPLLKCLTCGAEKLPGKLEQHCRLYVHDDGGAVVAYREQQNLEKRTCRHCGKVCESPKAKKAHISSAHYPTNRKKSQR